jgi:hypothetical protein
LSKVIDTISEKSNLTLNLSNDLLPPKRTTITSDTKTTEIPSILSKTFEKKIKPIAKSTRQSALVEKTLQQRKEILKFIFNQIINKCVEIRTYNMIKDIQNIIKVEQSNHI